MVAPEECPVCGVAVSEPMEVHMAVHSKDEVVSAILNRSSRSSQRNSSPSQDESHLRTGGSSKISSLGQNSLNIPSVISYMDGQAVQLMAASQAAHQETHLQRTSLMPGFIHPSHSSVSSFETQIHLSQQSSSASTAVSSSPLAAGNTLQIRKTLNNVNIVNNIGSMPLPLFPTSMPPSISSIGTSTTASLPQFPTSMSSTISSSGTPVMSLPQFPPSMSPSISSSATSTHAPPTQMSLPQFPTAILPQSNSSISASTPAQAPNPVNPVLHALSPHSFHMPTMMTSMGLMNPMGMMGGGIPGMMPFNMMSSTPLLLPQANGPTLLVNVPSYMAYPALQGIGGVPNMMMPSMFGSSVVPASTVGSFPQVVVPTPVLSTSTPSSQAPVVSTSGPAAPTYDSFTPSSQSSPRAEVEEEASVEVSRESAEVSRESLNTSEETRDASKPENLEEDQTVSYVHEGPEEEEMDETDGQHVKIKLDEHKMEDKIGLDNEQSDSSCEVQPGPVSPNEQQAGPSRMKEILESKQIKDEKKVMVEAENLNDSDNDNENVESDIKIKEKFDENEDMDLADDESSLQCDIQDIELDSESCESKDSKEIKDSKSSSDLDENSLKQAMQSYRSLPPNIMNPDSRPPSPTPGPSTSEIPLERHQSVISHSESVRGPSSSSSMSPQVPAIQLSPVAKLPRNVATIQDSLLTGNQSESNLLHPPSSPELSSPPPPEDKPFAFTQFSSDSTQLPQLTLNFPSSVLMESQPPSSPFFVAAHPPVSSVIVSASNSLDENRSSSPIFTQSLASQQPITVDTIEALQSALACDNDVQLVVSNELLETNEFRALMQSMEQSGGVFNSASLEATPHVSPVPPPIQVEIESQHSFTSNPPPPAILEESNPPSPIPCSSRDMSREATRLGFDSPPSSPGLPLNPTSDDDMSIQDLIAVETIDESQMEEDDMPWTSQLSLDSFQYLSQVISGTHTCYRCGLNFTSTKEYANHQLQKCSQVFKYKKSNKGVKTKNRKLNVSATVVTSASGKPFPDDSNSWQFPDGVKVEPGIKPEIPADGQKPLGLMHIKLEQEVDTQKPLAAQSKHWKCGQCKVVFDCGPKLMEHLEIIKRSKIKCATCHLVYTDRKDLLAHRKKVHPTDMVKIKFDPLAEPKQEPELEDNKYIQNTLGEFVCDICDRAFKEKDMLVKHMSCHIELKQFECLECGKKYMKSHQLREHKKRHFEEGSFQCNSCQKRFFSPNKLREHIRIHTGETPLKCNICGKGFKRHSNLSEHKKIHDPNREVKPPKELFCHCGQVFKTQRDLDWHKEGVHEKIPKKCTFCGEVFTHSSSLTRHVRLKHEGTFMPTGKKETLYAPCPICSQMFYKTSINKHIRIKHQGQKPYQCDICKKQFVAKCNLDNHMWQHKNQRSRPFKCTLCKKAYLRAPLLEQHMRSHRGIKPFVCNECGLQFTVKSNWQRHVQEHDGTRNYECPHCRKRFTRSYYLTDHLKVHTGEKPYICGICGKTAATRSNYNSHLRTHITREPVNSEV